MGFDCFRDLVNKNIKLRLCDLDSDSLVNDQILREIRRFGNNSASQNSLDALISRFF